MDLKIQNTESLTTVSNPWDFDIDQDAKELENAMCELMTKSHGIGLAANQVGITKRVFVMGSNNIPGFPKPFALFNPQIIDQGDDLNLQKEGCLSYPGLWLSVKRHSSILVRYQNSKGIFYESNMSGLIARCFQHELDHLNGICFTDKVSSTKIRLAMKKIRKKK